MIPKNVEKITMTKEDYDRNVEKLLFDKVNAELKLVKIQEYLKNKNYINVGYFIEDEEGRDIFIDVKGDILDIIKEGKYE